MGNIVFWVTGREIGDWARAVFTISSDGALDRDSLTGEDLWAEIEEGGLGLLQHQQNVKPLDIL